MSIQITQKKYPNKIAKILDIFVGLVLRFPLIALGYIVGELVTGFLIGYYMATGKL